MTENKTTKMKLYKLPTNDLNSKFRGNSKQNLKIPIIQHSTGFMKEITKRSKITFKNEVQFKKTPHFDYSFDHSIIEGGKDFSIVSYFSDISLGDQETASSVKSSSVKFVSNNF